MAENINEKTFNEFVKTLLVWYRENGRKFPWRKKTVRPYEVWVSEVMLQQTQASRVVPYYREFIKKFPTVYALAKSTWQEFLPYYEGLGYYARGKNMQKTATVIVSKYGGKFPRSKHELLALPGVGEYTESAVRAFAYDGNVIAWDVNVKRVIARYFYDGKIERIEKEKVERYFKKLEGPSGGELNSILMDFGSLVCTARPKKEDHAEICPFGKKCCCFSGFSQLGNRVSKLGRAWATHYRVYLYLHKDHKEYYSETKKMFRPFLLPTGVHSRSAIKTFFLQKYALRLSVRPPHKTMGMDGKTCVFVNAQILSGKNPFFTYTRSDAQNFEKQKFHL